jgi:hypothetical protein
LRKSSVLSRRISPRGTMRGSIETLNEPRPTPTAQKEPAHQHRLAAWLPADPFPMSLPVSPSVHSVQELWPSRSCQFTLSQQ